MRTIAVPIDGDPTWGKRDRAPLGAGERRRRKSRPRRLFLTLGVRGWAAIAFLSAAQLLLIGLAAASVNAPSHLVAVAILAQVPIVMGAAAAATVFERRRDHDLADLAELTTLASRAEQAEATLFREQERLHELRATLTGVTLSQRLLNDRRAKLSRPMRGRLERLREAELARLERLLIDTPRGEVASVDLASILDPLVDSVRVRGCSVVWRGTQLQALGRPDDIAEIAHILLDNAARHAASCDIVLAVSASEEGIELRVSDQGPGVPPTLAPVLFERGTRTTTSHGEGLGLHIAHRLARDLGGDLRLDPNVGATGAAFVLRLPHPTGAPACLARAV